MITPQFTYDNQGKKVGVFLSIEDWEELEQIPAVGEIAQDEFVIPEWQMELGRKEVQNIANGNTELIEWEEVKKQFKI